MGFTDDQSLVREREGRKRRDEHHPGEGEKKVQCLMTSHLSKSLIWNWVFIMRLAILLLFPLACSPVLSYGDKYIINHEFIYV